MAALESEALLLGTWRNVEDLEECLSLPELDAILKASYERERRAQRFYAAFKGVDLDEDAKNDAQEAFDRVNRRAQAKLQGISEDDVDKLQTADVFGLEFEVEE